MAKQGKKKQGIQSWEEGLSKAYMLNTFYGDNNEEYLKTCEQINLQGADEDVLIGINSYLITRVNREQPFRWRNEILFQGFAVAIYVLGFFKTQAFTLFGLLDELKCDKGTMCDFFDMGIASVYYLTQGIKDPNDIQALIKDSILLNQMLFVLINAFTKVELMKTYVLYQKKNGIHNNWCGFIIQVVEAVLEQEGCGHMSLERGRIATSGDAEMGNMVEIDEKWLKLSYICGDNEVCIIFFFFFIFFLFFSQILHEKNNKCLVRLINK